MNGADLNNPEEVDALVELWMGTPQGAMLWEIMWKWAGCQDWMAGKDWFGRMKKQYVQIMQWHLQITVAEEEETSLPYTVL